MIVGWNDSFDAATAAHAGPPSQSEAVTLIQNQPFADLLVGAMTQTGGKLAVPLTLVIATTPENIRAVASDLLAPPKAPAAH